MTQKLLVKKIGPTINGTSKTTGVEYSLMELLLEFVDGSGYISAIAQTIEAYNVNVGDVLECDLQFFTKLLPNGKIKNEIRVTSLKNVN